MEAICRTDSAVYHDNNNVMSLADERAARSHRANRVEAYFDQFTWGTSEEVDDLVVALLEDDEVYEQVKKLLVNYASSEESQVQSKTFHKAITKACNRRAEFCIDHGTDSWDE